MASRTQSSPSLRGAPHPKADRDAVGCGAPIKSSIGLRLDRSGSRVEFSSPQGDESGHGENAVGLKAARPDAVSLHCRPLFESSPQGAEGRTQQAQQEPSLRVGDCRLPSDSSLTGAESETTSLRKGCQPRPGGCRSLSKVRRRHRSVKGAAHRCAASPLTARRSSAGGLSYDRRTAVTGHGERS